MTSRIPNIDRFIREPSDAGRCPRQLAHTGNAFCHVPEDLRTPWDWIDLVIFALLAVGGTFLISICLVFIFSAFGIRPAQLRTSPSRKKLFCHREPDPRFICMLGYLAAQTNAPRRKTVLAHSWLAAIGDESCAEAGGLRAFGCRWPIYFRCSSNSLRAFFRPKGKLPIETFFRIEAARCSHAGERAARARDRGNIFRGYIYPVIARSLGIAASVAVTGTLFGLLHAPQLWGGWTQIGLLVVVGLIFTYVRAATRTVFASYLLHLSYNSFLFIVFLVSTHWLRTAGGH